MAENNFAQMMAQWKALEPQADPGKPMPIAMGARGEVNVGGVLSIKGVVGNADAMISKIPQKRPGPLGALLAQMGLTSTEIVESFKKVAQAGAVQQASQADLFGQGGPSGGFAANIGSGPSGGMDLS